MVVQFSDNYWVIPFCSGLVGTQEGENVVGKIRTAMAQRCRNAIWRKLNVTGMVTWMSMQR